MVSPRTPPILPATTQCQTSGLAGLSVPEDAGFGVFEEDCSPWVSTKGGTSSMSKIGMEDVKLDIKNGRNDDSGACL